MTLGEFIKEARIEKGLTREQLAIELEISKVIVYFWEKGRSIPRPHRLPPLCRALGIDLNRAIKIYDATILEQNHDIIRKTQAEEGGGRAE